MTCEWIDLGDGAQVVICSRGRRGKQCGVAGCGRPAVALCDYPIIRCGKSGTCDAALCDAHRVHQPTPHSTTDYCRPHDALARRRVAENG